MQKNQEKVMKLPIKDSFKGVWIPRKICLNSNLTASEKEFLSIIFALSFSDKPLHYGGCYANNGYLATIMSTTKGAISKMISSMKKRGLIKIEKYINEEGITKRSIKVAQQREIFKKEDEKHYLM